MPWHTWHAAQAIEATKDRTKELLVKWELSQGGVVEIFVRTLDKTITAHAQEDNSFASECLFGADYLAGHQDVAALAPTTSTRCLFTAQSVAPNRGDETPTANLDNDHVERDAKDLFIFVKTIFGNTITVALCNVVTTDDLIRTLAKRRDAKGRRVAATSLSMRLMHAGRQVEEGSLLSDLNIKKHTTLRQVIRLFGGGLCGSKEVVLNETKGNSASTSKPLLAKSLAFGTRCDAAAPEPEYTEASFVNCLILCSRCTRSDCSTSIPGTAIQLF